MKLTHLETLALMVAAGGLGAKIATGVTVLGIAAWKWALAVGFLVTLGSLIQRQAWKS